MVNIGFHASHEQFSPRRLLQCVKRAEQAGFTAASCSDHFHPWGERQGESGFAWSWLGAALEATSFAFGTVTAPGQRYHPAIIAQAAATLAEMYPGRFWLAVGSGEALNERITGEPWPLKPQRNKRLKEVADILRALWAGETVTHTGYVTVHEARLYTRPEKPPLMVGAALTPETAQWLGSWADGLITAGSQHEPLAKIVKAFRAGGGEGKPIFLQSAVCLEETQEQALLAAHDRWRHAALGPTDLADLSTPAEFDRKSANVKPEQLVDRLRISARIEDHVEWLQADIAIGFAGIYLNYVGHHPEKFIDRYGESVLPQLRH